jgi:hypothetical protein
LHLLAGEIWREWVVRSAVKKIERKINTYIYTQAGAYLKGR